MLINCVILNKLFISFDNFADEGFRRFQATLTTVAYVIQIFN